MNRILRRVVRPDLFCRAIIAKSYDTVEVEKNGAIHTLGVSKEENICTDDYASKHFPKDYTLENLLNAGIMPQEVSSTITPDESDYADSASEVLSSIPDEQ